MNASHFLQQLYDVYYPKDATHRVKHIKIDEKWDQLDQDSKKELANKIFIEAEHKLSKKDSNAFALFETALKLDPNNADFWYRQGVSFSNYALLTEKNKIMLLANKSLKIACEIAPNQFIYWWTLAKVFFQLAKQKNDPFYLFSSRDKFLMAEKKKEYKDHHHLAKFYWDYALLCGLIAEHSGEAVDLKTSLEAFQKSLTYHKAVSALFWYDFANTYLQMGLLINDNRMYFQSIDYLKKVIALSPNNFDAWYGLAQCYTQLYINTMNESHFHSADRCYETAVSLIPESAEILLEWAQILGESGKWNKNSKRLKKALNKCQQGLSISINDFQLIAQHVESQALLGAYTNCLEDITEAEEQALQAIEDLQSYGPEIWYAYGICMNAYAIYYNDIEYDEIAIEKYNKGIKKDPSNAEIWHALAYTYCKIGTSIEDIDLLEKANKYFSRASSLKPACPSIHFDYAKSLLKLAQILQSKDDLENALIQFELTLNSQDDAIMQHPEWLFHYAVAISMLGNISDEEEKYYSKAIDLFHQVLLIDPDFSKIHFNIAMTFSQLGELTDDKKFFERAINFYQMAIKQDPEDDEAWLEWGLTLISFAEHCDNPDEKQQMYTDGEKKISRAGQLGNQHAFYHFACYYALLHRYDEAFFFLEKAKQNDILPSVEEMEEDEWLDNLHSLPQFKDFLYQLEKKEENISDET